MIHEFAIDPSILNNLWTFLYFADQVGVQHGRMISRMPGEWERAVLKASANEQPNKRKTIENRLIEMDRRKKRFYLPGRIYDDRQPWIDNAEAQHQTRPFRTIIAQTNPHGSNYITLADEIGRLGSPWNVPSQLAVRRSAQTMAQSISLFLQASSEFFFIDPHFDPRKPRFCRPLGAFLAEASNHSRQIGRVEYHVKKQSPHAHNYLTWADFVSECNRCLSHRIQQGLQVRFVQWEERQPGKELHDRYIITDIGGIGFGIGLDEGGSRGEVRLHLLDEKSHCDIRNDFDYKKRQALGSTYKFTNETIIRGTKP